MFGKNKRQVKNVTFVQPPKGEAYFYTPIAYAANLQNSKEKEEPVFNDSDLALAGKLKLIFEREKMTWFEIKEEKSTTPLKNEHFFALYYYPHRLVTSRASAFDEEATLNEIKSLFGFLRHPRPEQICRSSATPIAISIRLHSREIKRKIGRCNYRSQRPMRRIGNRSRGGRAQEALNQP
jgi:hypothetical protein